MRYLSTAVLLLVCLGGSLAQSEKSPLPIQKLEIGSLADFFDLLSTPEHLRDKANKSVTLRLRLEAKRDVDPSILAFKIGLFDEDNYIRGVSELRFEAAFPLKPGERVTASADWEEKEPRQWARVVIRQVERSLPKALFRQ